ncbi:uncharacterized protein LOC141696138 [Apium graveolens]|uniref:uncharacterized protein LOC141696138 n=1 Tax=Apium graveolens TaxID=4045 RepID=UPI003D7BCC44
MAEAYVVKKVLRVMPQKFLQITSDIEQFGDLEKMSIEEVIWSLKGYEERLRGQTESCGSTTQLLPTEEEWRKKDKKEINWLLTREEWIKKSNRTEGNSQKLLGKNSFRSNRDKSKVCCWNCLRYGHFAIECKNPKQDEEQKEEVNIAQVPDDEPTLLLVESDKKVKNIMLINQEKVNSRLNRNKHDNKVVSNLWYLDNGGSNHMTGQKSKFKELNKKITG